jgi:hypothetical protein
MSTVMEELFYSKEFVSFMFRKICYSLLALAILLTGQATFDAYYKPKFHNRFRHIPVNPDHETVKKLTLSGSSSYVIGQLYTKFAPSQTPVYVVDLQEKSTDFIKSYPQHWFGYDKGSVKNLWNRYKYYSRRLVLTGKLHHAPNDFMPAETLVTFQDLNYVSLLQTRKKVPDQAFIDQLISFMKSVPNQTHLHVYCREGKGRTSIVLLMMDILLTQGKIPLAQLIDRHHQVGSEDLLDTTIWENGTYTPEMLQMRKAFIERFYEDVRQGKYPL